MSTNSLNVFCFVVLCASMTWGAESTLPDTEVTRLVEANNAAVDSIHSVRMQIDGWHTMQNGVELDPRKHAVTWIWAREGTQERQEYKFHNGRQDFLGRPLNSGDLLLDGATERGMHNWDRDRPYALEDQEQGPLNAWIRPQAVVIPTPFPNPSVTFALMEMMPDAGFPRRRLSAFLQAARGRVTARQGSQPHSMIIRVDDPELVSQSERITFAAIEFDASRSYVVRRFQFGVAIPPSSRETKMIGTREVLEFHTATEGVHIPKVVLETVLNKMQPKTIETRTVFEASDILVNETLPSDSFAFAFPENAIVRRFPPVNGKVVAEVWGPDNTPVRQIRTFADLRPLSASGASRKFGLPKIIGYAALGTAVAAVAFVGLRRFQRMRQAR